MKELVGRVGNWRQNECGKLSHTSSFMIFSFVFYVA